jgi:DNA-binding NarL/FixJ family response regulator
VQPVSVLIADDAPVSRRALRAVLGLRPRFVVIGEAADGEQAIAAVARLQPAIVIMDARMPRIDGIAATARIKSRWPAIRVIVHSQADDVSESALTAGADAFIAKGSPVQDLLTALEASADRTAKSSM